LLLSLAVVCKAWHLGALSVFHDVYLMKGQHRKNRVAELVTRTADDMMRDYLEQIESAWSENETIEATSERTHSCISHPDRFMRHFTQTTALDLSITRHKQWERMTARALSEFTNLTQLDLHNNGAMTDTCLRQLTNLVRLNLAYCQVVPLPFLFYLFVSFSFFLSLFVCLFVCLFVSLFSLFI
jgi:hypothetical protein